MLHKFFEPGNWFAPKRYGFGLGLPIAWQGWVLMASFILAFIGLAQLAKSGPFAATASAIVLMVLLTAAFSAIVRQRTSGGWRWRWGNED